MCFLGGIRKILKKKKTKKKNAFFFCTILWFKSVLSNSKALAYTCTFHITALNSDYRIQPNYCTVRLSFFFSKLLEKVVVEYVSTYTKGTLKKKKKKKKKKTAEDLCYDAHAMFCSFFFSF